MSRCGRAVVLLAVVAGGCAPANTCPRVVFLDGAGWYTGDGPVRAGLKAAGYKGKVERFGWSALLGPLPDHVLAGPDHPKVKALADRIVELRRANPDGQIILMGLSAGTSLIVHALEKLPPDVEVDSVVFLSPSVSAQTDLREALRHVKGHLYATCSARDTVLSLGGSAGGEGGAPAGKTGFFAPGDMDSQEDLLYSKVGNIVWTKAYAQYGWDGGHVSAASSQFVRKVIGPLIVGPESGAPGEGPAAPPAPAAAYARANPAPPPPPPAARPPTPPQPVATAPPPAEPKPSAAPPPRPSPTPQAALPPVISQVPAGAQRAVPVDTRTGQYLHLLARGDPGDRRRAAKELRRHLSPPVIAGLIVALERDGSQNVRREAASSLGQLLARDAEPALRLAAREDQDGGVRKAALTSARKIQAAYGIVP